MKNTRAVGPIKEKITMYIEAVLMTRIGLIYKYNLN